MLKSVKKNTIFTGHYGSGKTEIAINYALLLREKFDRVALVDLDVINPYFRSREVKGVMEESGVKVVASNEDYFNTDLPALSPVITGVLNNNKIMGVIDLGGDDTGARVMARFKNQIKPGEYEMLFVVNPYRPFTSNVDDITAIFTKIEMVTGLNITGIVSNPNLLMDTTPDDIMTGQQTVYRISKSTGLPIKFTAVLNSFINTPVLEKINTPIMVLNRFMTTPWE